MKARLPAPERLLRLLALVPWVTKQPDGADLDEIVTRFDYPRAQLLDDLQNVLFFVGVYPFTPDALIEVKIDESRVRIMYADWFSRPLRLTSEESAQLFTSGSAAYKSMEAAIDPDAIDGAPSPLLRALVKLGAALGEEAFTAVDVHLGDAESKTLDALRHALATKRQIDLEYYSYGRDEFTYRLVDPVRLFSEQGNWYLAAWCNKANDARVFRVDRIRSAVVADTPIGKTDISDARVFAPKPDNPRVTLRLHPAAFWVLDEYPSESVEVDGETRIVRMVATSRAWLERLLLRLGPTAEMLEADHPFDDGDVRGAAARRILARYHADGAKQSDHDS